MNELLTTCDEIVFDVETIKRGGFLRATFKGREPQNGLVSFVSKELIKALVFTGTSTAGTYLKITAEDVNNGLCQLLYSNDLEEVFIGGTLDSEETAPQP